MSRGIVESGLFRTERLGLELRTSDPANYKSGEGWIRTDIAPKAEQLATFRFNDGGSLIDVPIFDSAASFGSGVETVFRVPIGGTVGVVPLRAAGNTGAYPQLKFQHAGNTLDWHDSLSVIPDSGGTHQWNSDKGSGTTWGDSIGTLDGSISGPTWVTGSGGAGDAYLSSDGESDFIDIPNSASEFGHWMEGKGTWFAWVNFDETTAEYIFDANDAFAGNNSSVGFRYDFQSSALRAIATNSGGTNIFDLNGGNPTTGAWRAVALTGDGSTARIFLSDSNDNLTEPANTSISNTETADLNSDVRVGDSIPASVSVDGDYDIHWTDNVARSQSDLQSFVDETKNLYP